MCVQVCVCVCVCKFVCACMHAVSLPIMSRKGNRDSPCNPCHDNTIAMGTLLPWEHYYHGESVSTGSYTVAFSNSPP